MEIGDRVIVKEKRATVKFVGELENFAGEWVGVDYDDPENGKHDGVLNGKRYFTSSYPQSGAFVKKHLVDSGKDLVSAIEDRYMDKVDTDLNEEDTILTSTKHIEFVGMEKTAKKQSNIFALTTIVLDSRNVSRPPPSGTPPFSRCRELNLYNNLLHRWFDIEAILQYFPVLEELVLRKNLMDTEQYTGKEKPWKCSSKLQDIILSDCGVSSATISFALACISSAVNLYALRNQISRFEVPVEMAARLQILDLEGNPLESFSNVVGYYPNLRKMSLVNCCFTEVDLTDDKKFPQLEHLNLLDNQISEWDSVQKLKYLPSLAMLFIKSSLFTAENDITPSEVITALLPGLKDLNRFDIKTTERRSAEIRFINKYSGLSNDKRAPFQADLDRLVEIWGPPVVDSIKKGVSMVKLTISGSNKTLEKSLPREITVQRLTEMLCRLFSMNTLRTKVFLKRKDLAYEIELDNPFRSLDHYSPETLDILLLVPT